jgi:drug/metabolite transporter (DMT)-like permease
MIAFVSCIIAATFIGIIFKLFPRYEINALNAIVINYTTCFSLGLLLDSSLQGDWISGVLNTPWFKFDVVMGFLFFMGFSITAYAIRYFGLAIPVLMQKMSILLTVSFAIVVFNEPTSPLEYAGLGLAVMAIITTLVKKEKSGSGHLFIHKMLLPGVLLFSAAIEIILYYSEKSEILGDQHKLFTTLGFGVAALIGWLFVLYRLLTSHHILRAKDLVAGILLGLPNYFSIYLLLVMLDSGWKGNIMYPMVNVSVLLLSAMTAHLVLREKLTVLNKIGVILAVVAILIIAIAQNITS